MAKKVVLITGHYWGSRRKAGYHWLADAYMRRGWEVLFFTAPISWLSVLKRDYRFEYPVLREANRMIQVSEHIFSFVWFTRWHPANMRLPLFNRLSHRLFKKYDTFPLGESEKFIKEADLLVFESSPGLLLVDRFKKINPQARIVYRVSDDLRLLHNHPVVLESEKEASFRFDLISVPSEYILRLFEDHKKLKLYRHGINKALFDRDIPNPYSTSDFPNLIFVGQALFDFDFLRRASRMFPDWQFHIIGPIAKLPIHDNIQAYGELPFDETVAYIKHADIGLQTRFYSPGAESLTDSLKVIQYRYCRLPIIAPTFLQSEHPNVYYYRPGDENSIRNALLSASGCDRAKIAVEKIHGWGDLAAHLAGES